LNPTFTSDVTFLGDIEKWEDTLNHDGGFQVGTCAGYSFGDFELGCEFIFANSSGIADELIVDGSARGGMGSYTFKYSKVGPT